MLRTTNLTLAAICAVASADQVFQPDAPVEIALSNIGDAFKTQLQQEGIPLKAGDSMIFTAHGNKTTGYQWTVDEDATNGAFTVDSTYKTDQS